MIFSMVHDPSSLSTQLINVLINGLEYHRLERA